MVFKNINIILIQYINLNYSYLVAKKHELDFEDSFL